MADPQTIRRVVVIGAGTMGAGIAQVCAQAGMEAVLSDVNADVLAGAVERVERSLAKAAEKDKLGGQDPAEVRERISTSTRLAEAAALADLAIEAVPERLDLKQAIFRQLEAACPEHAILATNTSSLPVTEVAAATATPARVIGLHFFNPPPRMPLLEIVRGERTADAVVDAARAFAERIGKQPIVVRDVPGFASSRLGIALGMEAIRMVEEGVASPEDIDRAMRLGYRHPMGPLELTDLVGLDVRLGIAEALQRELGERFRPPQLLRRMVRAGKLGRKTGEGFYTYPR
jgi:3-hydroxybutyryl-CoA dehydrogenase